MKKLFCLGLFFAALFGVVSSAHAQTTRILINVVQEQGASVGSALIKETEMLIARALLESRFDVITSDDLSARAGLAREDVKAARSGSMSELRKAAGLHGAAFVLSARAATEVHQEEVLNMQMSKALTSATYRIVDTAEGKTLDIGSFTISSASRSAQGAAHATYEKMSGDLARIVADKLPATLSSQGAKNLKAYAASFVPAPQPEIHSPQPTAAQAPAVAQAAPSGPAPATAPGPELIILNPPATRGFIPVARQRELNIEGIAHDPVGIAEVRINGEKVPHNEEGRFVYPVQLGMGENRFLVMAVSTAGQMASKDLILDRARDTEGPELVLIRPNVTRGFQIALRPEAEKTFVEGIVRDESDILFVRVNDQDVSFSGTGHFVHELVVGDATRTISIEAADIHGNVTRKSLEIARSERGGGLSSKNGAAVSGSPRKPVLWGLAIGVSKYSSSSINLRFADQDALKLETFFRAQEGRSFSEVHFKTLVNEDVNRNSIINAISRHLGKAAPDDVIFIFLAGHGIRHRQSGSYYFMPSDSDFENLLYTGLRMSDFEESVSILSNNVDKIILAMDTCHAGALEVGARNIGGGEDLASAMNAASGLYILSASKAGEVSLESGDFKLDPGFTGHGAFTYALVNAMRGEADYDKDGYVSLNEIFQFVSRQVPRLTRGQQHPYFRMQGTDLPLIRVD